MTTHHPFSMVYIESEGVTVDEVIEGEVEIEDGKISQIIAKVGSLQEITLRPHDTGHAERCLWKFLHGWAKERFAEELDKPKPVGFFNRPGWI